MDGVVQGVLERQKKPSHHVPLDLHSHPQLTSTMDNRLLQCLTIRVDNVLQLLVNVPGEGGLHEVVASDIVVVCTLVWSGRNLHGRFRWVG